MSCVYLTSGNSPHLSTACKSSIKRTKPNTPVTIHTHRRRDVPAPRHSRLPRSTPRPVRGSQPATAPCTPVRHRPIQRTSSPHPGICRHCSRRHASASSRFFQPYSFDSA
ncbi:hypothetical protein K458DRAFT_133 [Lentithecium fluviatile CBS 122367]|uniref:Uncharacterized protein n=1 Tax=Lentithecium fluviatile CBS 122367 TaxID=1168545 RepID=A0A6G1JLN3_9PLEO|nr:hypothetical protein K458DRAFT_133 [Lentithecium fluviatile CBS 122367]